MALTRPTCVYFEKPCTFEVKSLWLRMSKTCYYSVILDYDNVKIFPKLQETV